MFGFGSIDQDDEKISLPGFEEIARHLLGGNLREMKIIDTRRATPFTFGEVKERKVAPPKRRFSEGEWLEVSRTCFVPLEDNMPKSVIMEIFVSEYYEIDSKDLDNGRLIEYVDELREIKKKAMTKRFQFHRSKIGVDDWKMLKNVVGHRNITTSDIEDEYIKLRRKYSSIDDIVSLHDSQMILNIKDCQYGKGVEASVLYKHIHERKLPYDSNTTIQEMVLRLLHSVGKLSIDRYLPLINQNDLVNLIIKNNADLSHVFVDDKKLYKSSVKPPETYVKFLENGYNPRSLNELVWYYAKQHGVNMLCFKNPFEIHERLSIGLNHPEWQFWNKYTTEHILKYNYDPRIPSELCPDSISHYCKLEFGRDVDKEVIVYHKSMEINTFLLGISPTYEDTITDAKNANFTRILAYPIPSFKRLHRPEEVVYSYEEFVTYGTKKVVYHIDELTGIFENMFLVDPFDKQEFSSLALEKLRRLSLTITNPIIQNKWKKMISLMDVAIENVKSSDKKTMDFVKKHANNNDTVQLVDSLLKCGMYMRGWDGKTKYPISSKDTVFPDSKYKDVEGRVLEELHKIIETENKLKTGLLDLPMYRYDAISGRYEVCTKRSAGLTIKLRMNIVMNESMTNENACIRMTSKYFVSTAYRILSLMKRKPDFEISDVTDIF